MNHRIGLDVLTVLPGDRHQLAENPQWTEPNTLSWVDIPTGRITVTDVTTGTTPLQQVEPPVGCAVRCATPAGGLLLGGGPGPRLAHLADDGTLTDLQMPAGGTDKRMNDGACDPAGRLWIGGISDDAQGAALYRIDLDGRIDRIIRGLNISNGIGWSPDGATMYHVDSGPRRIYAYQYHLDTADLGSRRTLIEFPAGAGVPDGLTVDDDGCLWVALWDGAAIARIDPRGRITDHLPLPVSRPTSCCIGGGALWITTASLGLDDRLAQEPWSGRILRLDTAVTAPPAVQFRGSLPGQAETR